MRQNPTGGQYGNQPRRRGGGLRIWVLAFLSSSVFSASLLARDWGA